jgi:hypothetical protein
VHLLDVVDLMLDTLRIIFSAARLFNYFLPHVIMTLLEDDVAIEIRHRHAQSYLNIQYIIGLIS